MGSPGRPPNEPRPFPGPGAFFFQSNEPGRVPRGAPSFAPRECWMVTRDNRGRTPLHRAARDFDHECCQALLAAGANPNEPDNEGASPLYSPVVMVSAGVFGLEEKEEDAYRTLKVLLGGGALPFLGHRSPEALTVERIVQKWGGARLQALFAVASRGCKSATLAIEEARTRDPPRWKKRS